jgi:HAD superfamily hydrolase (TIGR01549 family)
VATFDIGGTLADGRLDRTYYIERFTAFIRSLGYDTTLSACRIAIDDGTERLRELREKGFEMKFEDFYSKILKNLGVAQSSSYIEKIRMIYWDCFPQTEKIDVRKLLEELYGKFKLGVISNSMSQVSKNFLEQNNLTKYFDAIAISGALGFRKPNPKIFNYVLEELSAEPNEVIHVGDSFEEDVIGAKNVGMKAVWICREKSVSINSVTQPDYIVNSITDAFNLINTLSKK